MSQPRLIVRLHARAAELAGRRELEIELPAHATGVTGAAIKRELGRQVPGLAALLGSCALASDSEFLADDAPVEGTQALHLIPPVSGG